MIKKRNIMKKQAYKRKLCITAGILAVLLFSGCHAFDASPADEDIPRVEPVVDDIPSVLLYEETETPEEEVEVLSSQIPSPDTDAAEETLDTAAPASDAFDISTVPAYSGEPYAVINNNLPYFTEEELEAAAVSYEIYPVLDALGRCGVCTASIGTDIMPAEERGEIGQIKPTGWHTVKYNDLIDGNYLYNRCHLIGFQLAGENANERNLITGTRYLNVEGMLPFENETADYVHDTGNHVLYRVTPVFEGDNLVASGVLMEAESVEDHGAGVCFNVYCYNVQPGIRIDYATGDSIRNEEALRGEEAGSSVKEEEAEILPLPASSQTETPEKTEEIQNTDISGEYVINTNTGKFHYSWCDSVSDIKPENREDFTGSRNEIIDRGYIPCKKCDP